MDVNVKGNIYFCEFKSYFEMCLTFIRLQEFYESPSPALRGKYFTLEEAIEKYAKNNPDTKGDPMFSYFDDWAGFNIPGHIFDKFFKVFRATKTRKLTQHENLLYTEVYSHFANQGVPEKYYVIGYVKGQVSDLKHEIAHAMYYLYGGYKKEMLSLLKKLPPRIKKNIDSWLKKTGYYYNTFRDETQAYLATGTQPGMFKWYDIFSAIKWEYKFSEIFERYSKEVVYVKS